MSTFGERFGRRSFLKKAGLLVPLLAGGPIVFVSTPARARVIHLPKEMSADLIIIGGGLGGCAAALAAARNHLRVILTEETDWIGGQLTQQAVPPDENQWIETCGGTRSYQALRTGIRDYYRRNYPLTEKAKANSRLNPGNCWVSRIGAEPRVGLAVLYEMLAPYLGNEQVRILLRHKATAAETKGDRVTAVRVTSLESGHELILRAPYFADATELGDLLPLTKTEYIVGAESQQQTGEPHAKPVAEPDNLQGFTMCFALDYLKGEDHVIAKPGDYDFWHDFKLKPNGLPEYRFLGFDEPDSKKIGFDPEARKGFWTYRRVADRDLFEPGFYAGDVILVNWPQNDFSFGPICDVSVATASKQVERAKQLSLSLVYWLQTEAPRPDGGTGWKGLRLRPDIVGTDDGLAKYPYIREGRRIHADFTVLEQHVTTEGRMHETGLGKEEVTAANFEDSVGIGHYSMDLHITTTGDHGRYGSTLPFQIPLGALLPRRVENLLPACKNIGVTHLTNGCYRLHPIEWNIGESVGSLIAFCLAKKQPPRAVRGNAVLRKDFQAQLAREGVPTEWPKSVRTGKG